MESRADLGDRYRAIQPVASAEGMALYHGVDAELERPVSVAVLEAEDDPEVRDWLRRELRSLARLADPRVARLLDVGVAGDRVYVVTERLTGQPLSRVLDAGAPEPALVLHVGADVAAVLAHAHAEGIIHGELTPAHVRVDDDDRTQVTGFGFARLAGQDTGPVPAAYVAPELRRGEPASPAADVYALGVLLQVCARACRRAAPTGLLRLAEEMTVEDPSTRPSARLAAARLEQLVSRTAPTRTRRLSLVPGRRRGGSAGEARDPGRLHAGVAGAMLVILLFGVLVVVADTSSGSQPVGPPPPTVPASPEEEAAEAQATPTEAKVADEPEPAEPVTGTTEVAPREPAPAPQQAPSPPDRGEARGRDGDDRARGQERAGEVRRNDPPAGGPPDRQRGR